MIELLTQLLNITLNGKLKKKRDELRQIYGSFLQTLTYSPFFISAVQMEKHERNHQRYVTALKTDRSLYLSGPGTRRWNLYPVIHTIPSLARGMIKGPYPTSKAAFFV
jgi:hypothetical protein